jgi:acetyltransferase-like isoleucine patch superfamily enzyme
MMRLVGPLLSRLRVGRFRDWYRWQWQVLRTAGTVKAENLPVVEPGVRLRVKKGATLLVGRDVKFYDGFCAYVEGTATVEIGDRTLFNVNSWIGAIDGLSIGADCLFAPMVTVTDGNHRFELSDVPFHTQGFENRGVTIGDNVWIGAKATIINSVGRDSVVGANAVVTRPVPAGSIAAGVPARVIGQVPPGHDHGATVADPPA